MYPASTTQKLYYVPRTTYKIIGSCLNELHATLTAVMIFVVSRHNVLILSSRTELFSNCLRDSGRVCESDDELNVHKSCEYCEAENP